MLSPLFVNILLVAVLVLIAAGAIVYIIRSKKKGKSCVGCPYCNCCSSKNSKNGCSSNQSE